VDGRRPTGKTSGRTSGGKKTVVRGTRKSASKKEARGAKKEARGAKKEARGPKRGAKKASKTRAVTNKPRRGGFDGKPSRGR